MNNYRKLLFHLVTFGAVTHISLISFGQQVGDPSMNIPVPASPIVNTGSYPALYNMNFGMPLNYVRTIIPDQPSPTVNTNLNHRQITEYVDGIGRPLQTVVKRGHADGNDIIQHYVYDKAGRNSVIYLPYARPSHQSAGGFDHLPLARLTNFYPPSEGQQPYSRTEYDNSPLNRVEKALPPGKSWVGSNRGVSLSHRTNTSPQYAAGNINNPIPTIFAIGAFPVFQFENNTIVYNGNYLDGQLYISATTDEDGNFSESIKDKQGKLICTRILVRKLVNSNYPAGAPATMFPDNYNYTFYVYDNLNRLRVVIPPGAFTISFTVENGPHNLMPGFKKYHYLWAPPTGTMLNNLCYQYTYDNRGRIIEKKIPGKEIEYFVYDDRDRLVLSQDGNLRQNNKWYFSFYDGLNRPTLTGLLTTPGTRSDLQFQATEPESGIPVISWRHYVLNYNNPGTPSGHYPSNILGGEILSYSYYDNYDQLPNSIDPAKIPEAPAADATVVPSSHSNAVKGMLTGTKVKVLDASGPVQWITTAIYYDGKGRVIQTVSNNIAGGLDYTSNLYYFQGMAYKNVTHHSNPASQPIPGANAALNHIKLDKTYRRNLGQGGNDQVWQLQQNINGGTPYNLAYYDYDHMGRVVVKQYTIANVLHEYNIRGWLNNIHARNPVDNTINYFKETLHYDDGFASKLYNGNIAGITWNNFNTNDNTKKHAYGYTYDKLGRLNHAEYRNNFTGAGNWQKQNEDYTTSNISYDVRGNILSMNQRGNGSSPIDMDVLTYNYAPNSNKLLKVSDAVPAANTGHLPDFKDNADLGIEYTYDANGNLITDANKAITSITYNHLNKPVVITVSGKGTITNLYDAAGNRLQKKVYDQEAGTTEIWNYIGNFVYKDNVLQYILNEEGRCRPELVVQGNSSGVTKFVYDYFIKDHLGNVRTTLAAEPSDYEYYARHEIATANSEQLLFENIAAVRDDKPGSTNPDDTKAARLNGSDPDRRIGTAIMLKVMPGDKFTFAADAYYEDDEEGAEESVSAEDVVSSLLATLGGGTVGGVPVSESGSSSDIINSMFANPENMNMLNEILNSENTGNLNAPKAGLNYLFFDKNMKLLPMSGSLSVGNINPGAFNNISVGPPMLEEPGYLIVYVDNRSLGKDAWFDNVQVQHYNAEVKEENHYYPFGLAISSEAMGTTPNPYKYQGKELEKRFGLEMYDFGARQIDPQLGRTWQPDPHADRYTHISPYASMNNNPVSYIDPTGKDAIMTFDKETNTLTISAKVYYQGKDLPQGAEARADYMKQINADLQSTFKNSTGQSGDLEYNIVFDISAEINEDIKRGDLKAGENIMTVDKDNAGLNQADGSKRSNVGGNMGYVQFRGSRNVEVHEMGHMLGLRDRYTDYKNPETGFFRSFAHDGFKEDLMGGAKLNLVQTHYNDYVHYYDFKINQGQKHLLPQYRSSTLKVPSGGVGVINSKVAEGDIPSGWIKR